MNNCFILFFKNAWVNLKCWLWKCRISREDDDVEQWSEFLLDDFGEDDVTLESGLY